MFRHEGLSCQTKKLHFYLLHFITETSTLCLIRLLSSKKVPLLCLIAGYFTCSTPAIPQTKKKYNRKSQVIHNVAGKTDNPRNMFILLTRFLEQLCHPLTVVALLQLGNVMNTDRLSMTL